MATGEMEVAVYPLMLTCADLGALIHPREVLEDVHKLLMEVDVPESVLANLTYDSEDVGRAIKMLEELQKDAERNPAKVKIKVNW